MILALAGGVGGAKLADGLAQILSPDELTIVVNTGDDFEHLGLNISPDLDTVMYTLAGLNNVEQGWGLAGETWSFMAATKRLGGETWFNLGDQDVATHVERTRRLRAGESLSAITGDLCRKLGIRHRVAPMTDDIVRTMVETDGGTLPFQDYFVRLACKPVLKRLEFAGADSARPTPAFLEALRSPATEAVVICPSNPFLSVLPILSLPGIKQALAERQAPVVAVSPIVGGQAVKGPAAKIMRELGMEVSPAAVAAFYGELLDGLVIDRADEALAEGWHGPAIHITDTIMRDRNDKATLAAETLRFAAALEKRA
ncbi:MAG TPA: 2-phospho-L-lactate transferase [Alphaproteobacteria bacterium]|nr:2-phospho-L-lactate transferase [Alphaproteobacteria bacterium]